MAKSTFNGKQKQDQVYSQFQRIIRSEKYAGPTLVEQIIEETARNKAKHPQISREEYRNSFRSMYNPNNPLNGSCSWTKQQWSEYRERVKAEKRAAALAAKESNKNNQ